MQWFNVPRAPIRGSLFLQAVSLPDETQKHWLDSIAAYQVRPNMSAYDATKAYVLLFTKRIREKLAGTGLHVTCLEPGATETAFGEDSGMGKLGMFSSATLSPKLSRRQATKATAPTKTASLRFGRTVRHPGSRLDNITSAAYRYR
ncbi:SDR family NAD(P)-dependent oxidoreductase [Stieleria marina]|uniref:Putative oxidoreductase n=1 Tax=Stieleria marina TaxID=1930275 RepID=A0A517NM93_9BACT|nr:putative oxidoreductase [Planctomycetes bacterium K23_9]